VTLSKASLRALRRAARARLKAIAQSANLWRDHGVKSGEAAFVERVRLLSALRELDAALNGN